MSAATEGKKRLARGFAVTDAMIADFKAFLQAEKVKVDEEAFAKDLDFIKAMIHLRHRRRALRHRRGGRRT